MVGLIPLSLVSGTILLVRGFCDFFGGDEGGAGADFDATQYYTKAEVNDLLGEIFRGIKNDTYRQLQGVDFAGKATTGWLVPSGIHRGIL